MLFRSSLLFLPLVIFLYTDYSFSGLCDINFMKHSKEHGAYCLGVFQNGKDPTTLLGGILCFSKHFFLKALLWVFSSIPYCHSFYYSL